MSSKEISQEKVFYKKNLLYKQKYLKSNLVVVKVLMLKSNRKNY